MPSKPRHQVSDRQYKAFVKTVAQDLRKGYTIAGTERRAIRRARSLFYRGWRGGREHARDLALQAVCDAPYVLDYGHDEIRRYTDGIDSGFDILVHPGWRAILAIVGGHE